MTFEAKHFLFLRDMIDREYASIEEQDRAESLISSLEAELTRLQAGKFTEAEIHAICHDLHGTVDARGFADGCAAEQRKLYGCAPDADRALKLEATLETVIRGIRDYFEQTGANYTQARERFDGLIEKLRSPR
jgi:hypothetical protein